MTGSAVGPLLWPGPDTILLDLSHPDAEACRRELAAFAELVTSPDHVHTYRLTDLGLWNARAAGLDGPAIVAVLDRYGSTPVPHAMAAGVVEAIDRFGRVSIVSDRAGLAVEVDRAELLDELLDDTALAASLGERTGPTTADLDPGDRGRVKQRLVELRWPAADTAALSPGLPFPIGLTDELTLRPYQRQAVDGWSPSGTGVIVLPCGAGKTVTALAAAAEVGARTLVLVTGEASLAQWRNELLRFTDVAEADIGTYSARRKEVRPITLATYHVVSARRDGRFRHLDIVERGDWGLIIYDEVHLLPSAVFQLTAGIQGRRRLGLTATLVREDGREADVFSLIGPKRFDVPWRDLELQGWLAPATCTEVRVVASDAERLAMAPLKSADQLRAAATVGAKLDIVGRLLARHPGEPALVIGSFLDGLDELAADLDAPLVTGATPAPERNRLYAALRAGEIDVLVVSKVANFSLDLPEVSVLIQVSGTFGSRQEEAQRLGRIVRPKSDGRTAHFYTVVVRDTVEATYAQRRQRFLTEQGYGYEILDGADVELSAPEAG